jgi:SAM-dependent methyltransferase
MKKFHLNRTKYHPQPKADQPRAGAAKTSWEGVADWYGGHLSESDSLLQTVVYPAAIKLLAPERGKRYLDIACGEGAFSRALVKLGAKASGFDAAPSLIERARRLAPTGADYRVADATAFYKQFTEKDFDGAVCLLAVQNIDRPEAVFKNAAGLLKTGAPLVIIMNHPAFRIPRQTAWGYEEVRHIQYRRVDMYMSQLKIPILAHPGADRTVKTVSYHRPISFYLNALGANGFAVTGAEELISNRVSDSGPRAKAENRSRAEFPLFLALRAVKIK